MSEKIRLMICNHPRDCQTIKELEAENETLKKQVEVSEHNKKIAERELIDQCADLREALSRADKAESRLAEAKKLFNESDALVNKDMGYPVEWWTNLGRILNERKKTLQGKYCTNSEEVDKK